MKYNPIGSIFLEGEHILKVVESIDDGRTCTGCWYNGYTDRKRKVRNYGGSCFTHGHLCTSSMRKDKKQVVFTKIH